MIVNPNCHGKRVTSRCSISEPTDRSVTSVHPEEPVSNTCCCVQWYCPASGRRQNLDAERLHNIKCRAVNWYHVLFFRVVDIGRYRVCNIIGGAKLLCQALVPNRVSNV